MRHFYRRIGDRCGRLVTRIIANLVLFLGGAVLIVAVKIVAPMESMAR